MVDSCHKNAESVLNLTYFIRKDLLTHTGKISAKLAKEKADQEYDKFKERTKNDLSPVGVHFWENFEREQKLLMGGKDKNKSPSSRSSASSANWTTSPTSLCATNTLASAASRKRISIVRPFSNQLQRRTIFLDRTSLYAHGSGTRSPRRGHAFPAARAHDAHGVGMTDLFWWDFYETLMRLFPYLEKSLIINKCLLFKHIDHRHSSKMILWDFFF